METFKSNFSKIYRDNAFFNTASMRTCSEPVNSIPLLKYFPKVESFSEDYREIVVIHESKTYRIGYKIFPGDYV